MLNPWNHTYILYSSIFMNILLVILLIFNGLNAPTANLSTGISKQEIETLLNERFARLEGGLRTFSTGQSRTKDQESNTQETPQYPELTQIISTALHEELDGYLAQLAMNQQNVACVQANKMPEKYMNKVAQTSDPAVYQQSNVLIDNAIANGVWTHEDNDQLDAILTKLTLDERMELASKFADAVNKQQLKIAATPGF